MAVRRMRKNYKKAIILAILLNTGIVLAESPPDFNKLVYAIGKAENSKKYPYGIKSIPIKGKTQLEREAYAKRICLNTVKNNWVRYQKTDKRIDYITFLGNKYCPINDPNDKKGLNSNWIRNVKRIYESQQARQSLYYNLH